MIPFGLSSLMTVSMPIGRRATNGLVPGASAIYLFNEGAGQILTDYSGNGYHGTLGADAAAPTWVTAGLSFDGGDSIAVPGMNAALAGKTGLTVMIVAKANGTSQWSGLLGNSVSDASKTTIDLSIAYMWDTSLNFRIASGGNYTDVLDTTGRLSSTAYECVVGRFVGGAALQVRRTSGAWASNMTSIPATINASPDDNFAIGLRDGTEYGKAYVAYLIVYPFALTDQQIAQNAANINAALAPRGIGIPL